MIRFGIVKICVKKIYLLSIKKQNCLKSRFGNQGEVKQAVVFSSSGQVFCFEQSINF
ncbi:MAG: hypothetical protein RL708_818 [Bacteroidota bacterium]